MTKGNSMPFGSIDPETVDLIYLDSPFNSGKMEVLIFKIIFVL